MARPRMSPVAIEATGRRDREYLRRPGAPPPPAYTFRERYALLFGVPLFDFFRRFDFPGTDRIDPQAVLSAWQAIAPELLDQWAAAGHDGRPWAERFLLEHGLFQETST